MSAIYAVNIARLISSEETVGRGTAMPVMDCDHRYIIFHYYERTCHIKKPSPSTPSLSSSETNGSNGMDSSSSSRGQSVVNTGGSITVSLRCTRISPTAAGGVNTTTQLTTATLIAALKSTLTETFNIAAVYHFDQGDLQRP